MFEFVQNSKLDDTNKKLKNVWDDIFVTAYWIVHSYRLSRQGEITTYSTLDFITILATFYSNDIVKTFFFYVSLALQWQIRGVSWAIFFSFRPNGIEIRIK